jgi:hypothetical protein
MCLQVITTAAELNEQKKKYSSKFGEKSKLWKNEDLSRASEKVITVPGIKAEEGPDAESTLIPKGPPGDVDIINNGYSAAANGVPPNFEALQKAFAPRSYSENAKAAVAAYTASKASTSQQRPKSAAGKAPASLRAPAQFNIQPPASSIPGRPNQQQQAYEYITSISAGFVPSSVRSGTSPTTPRRHPPVSPVLRPEDSDTRFPSEDMKRYATPSSDYTAVYADNGSSYRGSPSRYSNSTPSSSRPSSRAKGQGNVQQVYAASANIATSTLRTLFNEPVANPKGVRWRTT